MEPQPGLDSGRARLALVATGTLGVSSFLVLPALVAALVTQAGYTDSQISTVSMCQLSGIGMGSVVNLVLLRYFDWRLVARIGLGLLVLLDFASIFVQDYAVLPALRFVAGTAGGICVSFGAYALGQTRNADRNFGLYLTCQVSLAILGNLLMPTLVDRYGVGGVFGPLCALQLAVLIGLSGAIPQARLQSAAAGAGNDAARWLLCLAVLAALVGFFIALGAFWTYLSPIGIAGGLTQQQTGFAASMGQLAGLGASLTAAAIQIRYGRLLPVITGVGLMLGGVGLLYAGFTFTTYVIAAALFSMGWYLYLPYQFGLLAALDRDGRPQVLSNFFAGLGSGLGPALVADKIGNGFGPAYDACILYTLLSLAAMLSAMWFGRTRLQARNS